MNILGLARHGLTNFEQLAIMGVLLTAFISLLYAWLLRGIVLKKDKGTQKMQEVWNAIRIGADSYLNRQLKTILPAIGFLGVVLFFSVYVIPPSREAVAEFGLGSARMIVAIGRTIAFIMGATFSLLVGQLGMRMAIQANVRAASAARRGFNESLSIAYYAGTITGMLTDGLGLFGGTVIFIVFGKACPDALLGFGFGGTLLALFMRVGGGIYTKAADVGADLVGKVEKDIPEDDPRNAAVVADLVGDNVGDCAGMAADIFESYEVTIVSALILGLALMALEPDPALKMRWIVYPLIIRGIGVISSILGTFTVPIWEKFPIKFLRAHDAEESMFRSYEVSSVNTVIWSFLVAILYAGDWKLAMLTSVGVGPPDVLFYLDQARPGQGDRQVHQDRPGHHHPFRVVGGHGIERLGAGHDLRQLCFRPGPLRRLCESSLCPVWRGHDRHRHAQPYGKQCGHGLLRPDLRQRQRHRRNVLARDG
jgi:K(+)-stimulated pyrophosphate-energized sodium pump